jgi:hypothetical protein
MSAFISGLELCFELCFELNGVVDMSCVLRLFCAGADS